MHTHASTNLELRARMLATQNEVIGRYRPQASATMRRAVQSAQDRARYRRRHRGEDGSNAMPAFDIIETLTNLFAPFMQRTAGKGVDLTARRSDTQRIRHRHVRQIARQQRQEFARNALSGQRLRNLRRELLAA